MTQKLSLASLVLLFLNITFFNYNGLSQIKWVTKAPLPNLLTECASAVLNGKIYIIGGLEPGGISTATVHVYDPVKNSWSLAAPLPIAMHHSACAVANGKIYILGGYTSNPFQPVSDTYEYDPGANSWTPRTPVPTIRGASSAAELGGKIYVIGGAGFNLTQSTDINEAYNPVSNSWETKAPMPTPRDHHAVITLDTLVYSIGGRNFSSNIGTHYVVEAYSPVSNKWYAADSLLFRRSGFSVVVSHGKIIAIGGEWFAPGQSGLVAQIEFYDPLLNRWEFLTTMNTTRHGLGAGVVGDTVYTISGGVQAGFSYSDVNEAFVSNSTIGIEQISAEIPLEFSLYQNYPNPFNPSTKIRFDITANTKNAISLIVYDLLGRERIVLLNQYLTAGTYEVIWDASAYSSGIYFYELSSGGVKSVKKMVLLK